MEIEKYGSGVFSIQDFINIAECNEYLSTAEGIGYDKAMIQTTEGPKFIDSIPNNDRVIHDNQDIADFLFLRIREFLPASIEDWTLKGLNERLRFYRYQGSHVFKWHKDGTFVRSEHEESMLTMMIYLIDEFEGGIHNLPGIK